MLGAGDNAVRGAKVVALESAYARRAIIDPRYGSSPDPSAIRAQRGSRAMSTIGAKPQRTPAADASSAAIRATVPPRSGPSYSPHPAGSGRRCGSRGSRQSRTGSGFWKKTPRRRCAAPRSYSGRHALPGASRSGPLGALALPAEQAPRLRVAAELLELSELFLQRQSAHQGVDPRLDVGPWRRLGGGG